MKLRILAAPCVAMMLAIASPAAAQAQVSLEGIPADELTEARVIIEVMYPVAERDEIFEDMVMQIGDQFAAAAMKDPIYEEPGIKAIVDNFMAGLSDRMMPVIKKHMPSMLEATAVAYTREFSLSELRDIRAFAQTEAGAHYFRKVSGLLSDPAVAQANQVYFAEVHQLQRAATSEIQAEMMKYLTEHPEVIERLKARSN